MKLKRKLFVKSAEEVANSYRAKAWKELAGEYLNRRRIIDSQALENHARKFGKEGDFHIYYNYSNKNKHIYVPPVRLDHTSEGGNIPKEFIESYIEKFRKVNRNVNKGNRDYAKALIDSEAKARKQLRSDRLAKVKELKAKKLHARNVKIGASIVAGTAALGTGAYLAKKHYDNKKSEKKD